jgi:hypothetical protein
VALPLLIEAPHRRSRASLHCNIYNPAARFRHPIPQKSIKQFCVSGRE